MVLKRYFSYYKKKYIKSKQSQDKNNKMQISSKNIELEEYRREIGKMIHQISSKK